MANCRDKSQVCAESKENGSAQQPGPGGGGGVKDGDECRSREILNTDLKDSYV